MAIERIVLFLSVLFLYSCNQEGAWDCIKTAGELDSERRDLPAFDKISIVDEIELELVQDSVQYVIVHGGKNLIGKVETVVEEGQLRISNENFCDPVRSLKKILKVEVHVKDLKHIYTESVRNISSRDTLQVTHLTLEVFNGVGTFNALLVGNFSCLVHSGSIDINIAGKADSIYLYNLGLGYIYASEMIAPYCHLNHESTGDAYIYASNTLNIENYGSGAIYYAGNPTVVNVLDSTNQNIFKAD